jgi:hypothetical protein
VLVAAITLWMMFSIFLIAPLAGLPRAIGRVAMILCAAELVAMLVSNYAVEACGDQPCTPLAQAAEVAARTDIPALAGAFLVVAAVQLRRASRRPPKVRRRRATAPGAGRRRPAA